MGGQITLDFGFILKLHRRRKCDFAHIAGAVNVDSCLVSGREPDRSAVSCSSFVRSFTLTLFIFKAPNYVLARTLTERVV